MRGELLGVERLEELAAGLAGAHRTVAGPGRSPSLPERLEENRRTLTEMYRAAADSMQKGRPISFAGEWILDNFHIIQDQLRESAEDLPRGFYRELPKLVEGEFAGLPRVYALADTLVTHTDGHLDLETLDRFVRAYQRVSPLAIGELWAVPIALRLALLEDLARLAARIDRARLEIEAADGLVDELIVAAEQGPGAVRKAITTRVASRSTPSTTMFIAEMLQRLRDQDPDLSPAIHWLEQRLADQGTTVDEVLRRERQTQAANQVSVGNAITSMRVITATNWSEFFESLSAVDAVLREDPSGDYRRLDFATRDRYRHRVEWLARRTALGEPAVAGHAIDLARAAAKVHEAVAASPEAGPASPEADARRMHVGYYLVGDGLRALERAAGYRPSLGRRLARAALARPTATYLALVGGMTAAWLALLLAHGQRAGATQAGLLWIALIAVIPASDLAISLVNYLVTLLLEPRVLPKLDLSDGIPPECRTLVVVPVLFASEDDVREALDLLEIRYLGNIDDHLHFAILSDFRDAGAREIPGDQAILDLAVSGVDELNARYGQDRFYLFHRHRVQNAVDGVWMGWERKRGKLDELNGLLIGDRRTSFKAVVGDTDRLPEIRYVITLDADTSLPRDTARELVGALAHPLNRARIDPRTRRVVEGYGILQPRVSVSLEAYSRSRFSRIFSGYRGVDPYTTAVSDLYQDLFAEGSFVGKGIYDVRAFAAALAGRVPENTLLSHDLFEGCYARTALATDIELFDDYPSRYEAFTGRKHRWIRGDWQLAPWLWPWTPSETGRARNVVPIIGRWKMFDNLRRSLVTPATLVLLVAGWTVLPGSPLFWTLVTVLVVAFPVYAHLATAFLSTPRRAMLSSHFRSVSEDIGANTARTAIALAFQPHQTWITLDAIARTLWRLVVSRRGLLEWVTAAEAERRGGENRIASAYRAMWPAVGFALGAAAWIALVRPAALVVAGPFLAAWTLSPALAVWLGGLPRPRGTLLSADDADYLRRAARSTWRFFETFVTDADHWLPPDNFQESPTPVLARRTSPTNIGLALLANVSAKDFGYIGLLECTERSELTLATLRRLERHHGHLFNWYDTATLAPLPPRYVSMVDSGNLAGHLLVLKHACLEAIDRPLLGPAVTLGLEDVVALLGVEVERLMAVPHWAGRAPLARLQSEIAPFQALLADLPGRPSGWHLHLDALHRQAQVIADTVNQISAERSEAEVGDLGHWAAALARQVASHQRDLAFLAPWARLLVDPPESAPPALVAQIEREEPTGAAPTPGELVRAAGGLVEAVATTRASEPDLEPAVLRWLDALQLAASTAMHAITDGITRLSGLAYEVTAIVDETNFDILFDPRRKLFAIGLNVETKHIDNSYYDLLASEARLGSFVAVAKGDVPAEHWHRLGRALVEAGGDRALASWSGSMFEYLMPSLVMRSYAGTLLDRTCRAAVREQIAYARRFGVPWGISEAAYNARDLQRNYQYGPFGVPTLGLKRGLKSDLVVAPYATALALLVEPEAAANLRRLEAAGARGRYGFYESIDFTPSRVPKGKDGVVVQAFMAHHAGMTLLALGERLLGERMKARFHAEPLVRAHELLLYERSPRLVPPINAPDAGTELGVLREPAAEMTRYFETTQASTPRINLLSNGSYSVMLTTAGGGYSRRRELAITRWREDVTRDHWGQFCYLTDVASGETWSTTYQPTLVKPDSYTAIFSLEKAEYRRVDHGIEAHTTISVSSEDDAEVRTVRLENLTARTREIELTSYGEIVLASPAADQAHPAFSNLFVETEFAAGPGAILVSRRKRAPAEPELWALHVSAVEGAAVGAVQFETDRARFLGRGHTTLAPAAVSEGRPLSNTAGAVLDPIFSLRRRIRLGPYASARVLFTTAFAGSREHIVFLAAKYGDVAGADRASDLAWTNAQVELRHLGITAGGAQVFLRLASRLLYVNPDLRARPEVLAQNRRGQSGLWAYGISGDLPIILARVSEPEHVPLVRELLRAHELWRLRGLATDLVILNEHPATYQQELQDMLLVAVRSSFSATLLDAHGGGVFVRRADLMPDEDRTLLLAVARAVLVGGRGTLAQQIERKPRQLELMPPLMPRRSPTAYAAVAAQAPAVDQSGPPPGERGRPARKDQGQPSSLAGETPVLPRGLEFWNGIGGFAAGGREYVIVLSDGQTTPAPWVNVIANPRFGFVVSEAGGGHTWAENGRENRLTPWSNDPVSDPVSEAIYIRDDETGAAWSPTPQPMRTAGRYVVRHGQGYSTFEHSANGITSELTLFVPVDDPIKLCRLRLTNVSGQRRQLAVMRYAELVLGVTRELSAPHVVTEIDEATGALLARNPYNNEFAGRVAFADATPRPSSFTCERKEFIGRNGSLAQPNALGRTSLAGQVGAGYDPCAAQHVAVTLEPESSLEIVFALGEGADLTEARALIERYRQPGAVDRALAAATERWDAVLGAVQVKTPDRALDLLVNRWLLYQTIGCRVWARASFYASGGAYGFRDQLQDVAAAVYAAPELAREHILRAAARQFAGGDVQHWWHPPTGRGVRTRFSDDLLWLPLVAMHYARVTGDAAIFDEPVGFIEARELAPTEDDVYLTPEPSSERASLFEHCARAIERSLAVGAHGLPLMGTGDWNDGMNRVGHLGKGESVWVGWFLVLILRQFGDVCDARGVVVGEVQGDAGREAGVKTSGEDRGETRWEAGDESRGAAEQSARYRAHAAALVDAIEGSAWDGDWYLRAFFDDGSPLGSARSEECRIDSIAQTWGVISGAASPERQHRAMAAVEEVLVHRGDGLVKLLTPPFDRSSLDPGYIRGYVPGVRENGGQYTHAALWVVLAHALLGDGDRAGELLAMLNPVSHTSTRAGVHRYKVEPYVAVADVYAIPPHTGRGGWTWYTGSASWMYRIALESILGFTREGDRLRIDPCIPRDWPGFEIVYRHGQSEYAISVENPGGVSRGVVSVDVDGVRVEDGWIALDAGGGRRGVRVLLGG